MAITTLLAALIAVVGIAVYFVCYALSHRPREPVASELLYRTNDDNGSHELPPRIHSHSRYKDQGIELSVVVPCYNETERLGRMLDESLAYLKEKYGTKFEVLIVDDGSSDGTADYALALASKAKLPPHTMKVVQLVHNRGKGGAVTHGALYCSGKYMLFADADGATSFEDTTRLVQFLDAVSGPAVAVGARAHMVNTEAVVKRSFIRNFLMYGLHALVFVFGIRQIHDTQCGFKMFNFDAVKNIFPHMHTERWIFDVEVLLIASLQSVTMSEIAVNWQEIDGSKVDLARDSILMAVDLVVTRVAYMLGIYQLDECGRMEKHKKD